MGIFNKKFNELNNIFENYKNYNGIYKSEFEKALSQVENKLSSIEYENLQKAFENSKIDMLKCFANSRRIKVFFDYSHVFDDIEQHFLDLE